MFYLDSGFKRLSKLRYLDIRSNKFREFPEAVSNPFPPHSGIRGFDTASCLI